MAHCDCNHEVDSNLILTRGDSSEYQAIAADMPSYWFNPQQPTKATEEKKSTGFDKRQWNIRVHSVLAKANLIAKVLILAGVAVSAVAVTIYMVI